MQKDTSKKSIILLIIYSFISISNISTNNELTKNNYLALEIADLYLKSFTVKEKVEEKKGYYKEEKEKFDIKKLKVFFLNEKDEISVCLTKLMISPTLIELENERENILNEYFWKDLKIFYGTTSNTSYHFISRINKTITKIGEASLLILIASPSSNIEELKRRQNMIKYYIEQNEVYKEVKNVLEKYRNFETRFISFWTDTDPLYSASFNKILYDKFLFKDLESNKNVVKLELHKRFARDYWDIFFGPTWFLHEFVIGHLLVVPLAGDITSIQFNEDIFPGLIPFYNFYHTKKNLSKKKKKDLQLFAYLPCAIATGQFIYSVFNSINKFSRNSQILTEIARRLHDVKTFLKTIKVLNKIITSHPDLEKTFGNKLKNIRKLLQENENNKKTELGTLVYNLNNLNFESWSYFLDNAGKLLSTYVLFLEHKDKFKDAMFELGRIDAFHSIATLYMDAQNYNDDNKFIFVNYLSRKEKSKPYFKIDGMWNPFLDSKIAVKNELEMNGASAGTRNIILTGPNAGGKSTFINGITLSILLAQVFGIAPASQLTLTPFNKINSYIEILDDIAAGKSLFMAEVLRALGHINLVRNLKEDGFAFTIFDEPFSGTNPLEGGAAEYSILKNLSNYSNSLQIVATHYPIVTLLEEKVPQGGFKNYKVFILPPEPGSKKINYTFKVIPGKSNQAIAIDILEAEGYDASLLSDARDIIANPGKYYASFKGK